MKIISVVLFAAALSATWALAHTKKVVPESVHAGIQADLQRVISEYVQKKLPESKNLRFEKFYTETVNANRVKAFFSYTYQDKTSDGEPTDVEVAGSATLNKLETTGENSTWSFDDFKMSDNEVSFTEPLQITARPGQPAAAPTETKDE